MMLIDSALVFWYWRRHDRSLTVLGAFLPRAWVCVIYAIVATGEITVDVTRVLVRAGWIWLALAEIVHFGMVRVKHRIINGSHSSHV